MPPKRRGRSPKKRRNLAGFQQTSSLSPISQARHTDSNDIDELVSCHVLIGRSRGAGQLPSHHKKDRASSETEESGEESDAEDYGESCVKPSGGAPW